MTPLPCKEGQLSPVFLAGVFNFLILKLKFLHDKPQIIQDFA